MPSRDDSLNAGDEQGRRTDLHPPTTDGQPWSWVQDAVLQRLLRRARYSPGKSPTGTVNFYDGNVSLGTATISRGTAKLTTSQLSAGTHNITAIYGGNTTNAGSESGTLEQVVKVASSTAISSSLNPSARGQSVTFTATVNGNNPTGSVTFRDGIRSLGAVTLSGGTATYTSGTLAKRV